VHRIFEHVDHLESHPRLGSKPEELKGWRYRQIVETNRNRCYQMELPGGCNL
jgi:toxin ParE1/3/4